MREGADEAVQKNQKHGGLDRRGHLPAPSRILTTLGCVGVMRLNTRLHEAAMADDIADARYFPTKDGGHRVVRGCVKVGAV